MQKMIFLLCAVALAAIAQSKPVGTPKLSIHKNNIKVWTYQNEQNPVFLSTPKPSYTAHNENAVSLILNIEHAVQWVPYMGSIKILSRDAKKGDFTLYMVLDFPFPLKDRDLIVQ